MEIIVILCKIMPILIENVCIILLNSTSFSHSKGLICFRSPEYSHWRLLSLIFLFLFTAQKDSTDPLDVEDAPQAKVYLCLAKNPFFKNASSKRKEKLLKHASGTVTSPLLLRYFGIII